MIKLSQVPSLSVLMVFSKLNFQHMILIHFTIFLVLRLFVYLMDFYLLNINISLISWRKRGMTNAKHYNTPMATIPFI